MKVPNYEREAVICAGRTAVPSLQDNIRLQCH